MPDREGCSGSKASLATSATSPPGARISPVAYPLDEFYARAGVPLPEIEMLEASALPQPYRRLLAHSDDMTPTLSAFHARIIHLRVLSREQRDDFYYREVVLLADGSNAPVEYGAIRINLALFATTVRRHILDERVPLGHLLRIHAVPHSSRPKAFFRLRSDGVIGRALGLVRPQILYGRRNTLLDAVNRPLAEVVEVLPPAPQQPEGYSEETL